jgi:hypothetical protein
LPLNSSPETGKGYVIVMIAFSSIQLPSQEFRIALIK